MKTEIDYEKLCNADCDSTHLNLKDDSGGRILSACSYELSLAATDVRVGYKQSSRSPSASRSARAKSFEISVVT